MNEYATIRIDNDLLKKTLSFRNAKNALVLFFQETDMPFYSNTEDGGHFQLYYRLNKTGLSIQQSIYIHEQSYVCRTTIAEIAVRHPWQAKIVYPLLIGINSETDCGRFNVDSGNSGCIRFWNRFCPEKPFTEELPLYYFENFAELIGVSHFLIDEKYGTDFRRIRDAFEK